MWQKTRSVVFLAMFLPTILFRVLAVLSKVSDMSGRNVRAYNHSRLLSIACICFVFSRIFSDKMPFRLKRLNSSLTNTYSRAKTLGPCSSLLSNPCCFLWHLVLCERALRQPQNNETFCHFFMSKWRNRGKTSLAAAKVPMVREETSISSRETLSFAGVFLSIFISFRCFTS